MKIRFLGTGTSQGIPVVACDCEVCNSTDVKDKRLRSSVLIEKNGSKILIDAGPDFRQQMLLAKVDKLAGILLTHEHKDHVAGLDDVRGFNYIEQKPSDVYAEKRVLECLKNYEFHYAFRENKYPGIAEMNLLEIENKDFFIQEIKISPVRGLHHKLPVLGFKIDDFVYITDMNFISDQEIEKIRNCKVFVINAVRKEWHFSHFNLSEALEVIKKVCPQKAYITHISHRMGFHEEESALLPENVFFSYDNLEIVLQDK